MIRITLVISLAILLSGCESFLLGAQNTCGGRGHKNVKIEYGDGKLLIDPVVKVKKKKELRFRLYPERRSALGYDYEKADVETIGKVAAANWLNEKRAWDPDRYLVVCVDDGLVETGYNYSVVIFEGGTANEISRIDPRIIVEPK